MATYYQQAQLEPDEQETLQRATDGTDLETALKAVRKHLKNLRTAAHTACDTGTLTTTQAAQARDGLARRHALLTSLQEHGVDELAEYIAAHTDGIRILDAISNGDSSDTRRPSLD